MYFGRGFAQSEIGDCNVIVHEGQLHLFHVVLPSHDTVAHLVSEDGVHWRQMPYALRTSDPGAFDDDQIWTMSVFRWEGRFYMLYTALCQADDGLIQRSGLAVSDDLIRWEKTANNPVAAPDARWYEADTSECGRADWRDPFGWVEGDTIHGLVCAHNNVDPQNRRGCVGHFVSKDAVHWEVLPPFYSPGLASDWEVPAMMKLDGRYYLLGHTCAPSQDIYRVADKLEGPWRRPVCDWILPKGAHIFCPVEWQGRMLFFHWLEAPFDWPDRRRVTGPHNGLRAIAPPKEAVALENGDLELRSCDFIWDTLVKELVSLPPIAQPEQKIGMGFSLLPGEHADFVLEATITLDDACEAGIFWRSNDDANTATFLSLIPGRQRVELQRTLPGSPAEPRRLGRGITSLQENHFPLTTGQKVLVRVITWGPYNEISLNGRVVLCYLTMSRRSGRIGFFMNDGSAAFDSVRLRTLEPPSMPEAKIS